MRALVGFVGLGAGLAALAGPTLAVAATPHISIGAIQGEKSTAVSRQVESALCPTFECVPRSEVVTRGKVDFKKMRERGVSAFLFGAVTPKGSGTKLWLALLTTSDHPSRTWNVPVAGDGRLAGPALDTLVEGIRTHLEKLDSAGPPATLGLGASATAAAMANAPAPSASAALGRIAIGSIQGDPQSRVSAPLRTAICAKLECVKRSQVVAHGHVDLAMMGKRQVGGFLFGSVGNKAGTRTLWLALITNSEKPASTWSLPLTARGTLPGASVKATTAELVDILAIRAAEAEIPAGPQPTSVAEPPAESREASPPVAAVEPSAPAAVAATEAAVNAAAIPAAPAAAAASAPLAASTVPQTVEPSAAPPAPAQATAPQAPSQPAPSPAKPEGHRTEGLIPGILIGPKATATLLFPPNVMVGAELKVIGWFGASFEYGVYPRNLTVSDYSLSVQTWSAGLRAYPFRGTFFVGAVLGSYNLTGAQTVGGESVALNVKSMYLGPQIGWKWDFDVGLFLGLNLGYGFSLNYTSTLSGTGSSSLQTAKENADKYLKFGVPVLTLVELGWLF